MAPSHQTSVVVIDDDDVLTIDDDNSDCQVSRSKPAYCFEYFHSIFVTLEGTPFYGDVTSN
jgi:hypothetical protein